MARSDFEVVEEVDHFFAGGVFADGQRVVEAVVDDQVEVPPQIVEMEVLDLLFDVVEAFQKIGREVDHEFFDFEAGFDVQFVGARVEVEFFGYWRDSRNQFGFFRRSVRRRICPETCTGSSVRNWPPHHSNTFSAETATR